MKHLKHLFTAFLLICSTVASAYDFEANGIFYNITDKEARTVEVTYSNSRGNSYNGDVIIPPAVIYDYSTYLVTGISERAFIRCTKLTSITIPNSVASIGNNAFSACTSLARVINFSNLTFRKGSADYGKIAYYANEVINIPGGSIDGDFIFGKQDGINALLYYLGNTAELTLPANFKGENYIIGRDAFRDCIGIARVTIPNSVTSIGDFAFYGCTSLASVTIPNSIISIGYNAFSACTSLSSVEIPSSVTSIGSLAFSGCTNLESITVDDINSKYDSRNNCNAIIETAENRLLAGCKKTIIPSSITGIGSGAFLGCSGLASIVIPNSVTRIEYAAFDGCTGLASIEIPSSVTNIGGRVFAGCSALANIEIPNSVTNIEEDAFYYCTGLTSVTIPNSVTNIGGHAFLGCTSLASIEIPNSVTTIGNHAFYGCTGLKEIAIGNGVTSIEEETFKNCSGLTTVKVNDIASWCNINFVNENSNPLAFAGNLYLNGEKVTELIIPDNVTEISNYAFMGCTSLESVAIGNKMTTIGKDAFKDCSGLKAANINDITNWCNIAFANEYSNPLAFAGNLYLNGEKVTKLVIPENVTNIAGYAFRACTSLESLVIGKQVTNIGYEAFCRCSSLTELEIGGAPYLEQAAFSRTGMEEIILPEGITNIGNWGFDSSPNLKSFVIPSTVREIGNWVFQCCNALECVISKIPAEELFEANAAFAGMETANCILYVPKGAKEKYETTEGWGEMFAEVREYDDSMGIDGPECENSEVETIHDLTGRIIETPTKGIYIVNGKKVFLK